MTEVPVISIIDDDDSVRIAISRLVRSLGYLAHAFELANEFLSRSTSMTHVASSRTCRCRA